MIKLFRNLRQNLLNEGKTSRYLKYAIGEIILVGIGILQRLFEKRYCKKDIDKILSGNLLRVLKANETN